jgi:hypothetical protein
MNKTALLLASTVCTLAFPALAQERGFSQQAEAGRDFTQIPVAEIAEAPATLPGSLGFASDTHLTCPFDLIQAAYEEATSNYGVAARYVTAMEVMELCNDHAEVFRQAIENEVALRERYNELFAGQGIVIGRDRSGAAALQMADDRDAGGSKLEEAMASQYQPLKSAMLACEVPIETLAALTTPATVRFNLDENGKVVGAIDHMTAPNEAENAASYVAAKDVVNGCEGAGYPVDGFDLARPFVAKIGLSGATLDILINEEITRARQAEIEACLLDRPASHYAMTGYVRAAGADPLADLSPTESYSEEDETFAEKIIVRQGDKIGDMVTVSEVYVPFPGEPGQAQVVLTDCAGDLVLHMAPRSNRPTMIRPAEVTYRNRLTGEVRQPEVKVIETEPFSN